MFKVRTATPDDFAGIFELHKKLYKPIAITGRMQNIAGTLCRNPEWTSCIEKDGQIVAFGSVCEFSTYGTLPTPKKLPYPASSVEIGRVAVDPAFQGGTFGVKIIHNLKKIAEKTQCPVVYGNCTTENTTTQRISQFYGYRPVGILVNACANYYLQSDDRMPFHSVFYFRQVFDVGEKLAGGSIKCDRRTEAFIRTIVEASGMQKTQIDVQEQTLSDSVIKGELEQNRLIIGLGTGIDIAVINLNNIHAGMRLAYLGNRGFIPTCLFPFCRAQKNLKTSEITYQHVLILESFKQGVDPGLDTLKINEDDASLRYIRDAIIKNIKV